MDFGTNTLSVLAANKQKREEAKAAAAPAPAPAAPAQPLIKEIPAPSGQAPAEVKKDEAVPVSHPGEPAKPEKPIAPAPETTEPTNSDVPPTEQQEEFKWDDGIPDTTAPLTTVAETVPTDLKKIGSALKLEVKDEQEFVATVSEKLARLQELEKLSLDGIPDELKQAIDVAKKGGDWLTYTKAVGFDANSLDPVELFDREYERANVARFKKPDGSVDWEAFDQELDAISPGLKLMQGQALKSTLVQQQQFQKAQVLSQTTAQQETFQKGLGDAAKNLNKLIPQEQFGVLIEPKHSAYFYQGIADGSLVKKHLGSIDPAFLAKFDSQKLMKTVVLAELAEKISTLRFKQGETAGKKSLLKETTNAQVQQPSFVPRPEEPNAQPAPTSAQRLSEMKERNQPKNSL